MSDKRNQSDDPEEKETTYGVSPPDESHSNDLPPYSEREQRPTPDNGEQSLLTNPSWISSEKQATHGPSLPVDYAEQARSSSVARAKDLSSDSSPPIWRLKLSGSVDLREALITANPTADDDSVGESSCKKGKGVLPMFLAESHAEEYKKPATFRLLSAYSKRWDRYVRTLAVPSRM